MKLETLMKKIILIFTIIAMLVPYVPVYTPAAKAATTSETYIYTGGIQTFTATESGIYLLEVYGAQGGASLAGTAGGLGGYAYGNITLYAGQTIYICVGQAGADGGRTEYTYEEHNQSLPDSQNFRAYNGGGASGWNVTEETYDYGGDTYFDRYDWYTMSGSGGRSN